jgi:hypothetical protein
MLWSELGMLNTVQGVGEMNKRVKAPVLPGEPMQMVDPTQNTREVLIPEGRTKAAAAEVRFVNGKWTAVRLDGGRRVFFGNTPPPSTDSK